VRAYLNRADGENVPQTESSDLTEAIMAIVATNSKHLRELRALASAKDKISNACGLVMK
jgi:hypothetical protein